MVIIHKTNSVIGCDVWAFSRSTQRLAHDSLCSADYGQNMLGLPPYISLLVSWGLVLRMDAVLWQIPEIRDKHFTKSSISHIKSIKTTLKNRF